jgi:hypothetical protein
MFNNCATEINPSAQGIKCSERSKYKGMIYLGQYIIVTESGLKWNRNIVLAGYDNKIHSILYEF